MKRILTSSWYPLGMLLALTLLAACDPNQFNPQTVANVQAYGGRLPIANGRLAVVACRSLTYPVLQQGPLFNGSSRPFQSTPPATSLTNGTSSFQVMAIDPSGIFDGYYGRYTIPTFQLNSGVHGYLTRYHIEMGSSEVGDLVIDPSGSLVLATFPQDNSVAALQLTPDGQLTPLGKLGGTFSRPTRMAISHDYALVVNEGNDTISIIDIKTKDFYGRPEPRIFGSPVRVNRPGAHLHDVAIDPENNIFAVAAEHGGVFVGNIDIATGNLPPAFGKAGSTLTPQQVYDGFLDQQVHFGGISTRVAISEQGFIMSNDRAFGPSTFGSFTSLPLQGRQSYFGGGSNNDFLNGTAVVDMKFSPHSNSLLALTRNSLHVFDTNGNDTLGFQRQTTLIGRGNTGLAVDPQGDFSLVTDPSSDSVYFLRNEGAGQISFGGSNDTILTTSSCSKPQKIAISAVRAQPLVGPYMAGYTTQGVPNNGNTSPSFAPAPGFQGGAQPLPGGATQGQSQQQPQGAVVPPNGAAAPAGN